jgi:predicted HicB family RNase H-like nuclease
VKHETETLYARVPKEVMAEVRARAEREQRTLAAVVSRMLTHAMLCPHKITIHDVL